MGNTTFVKNMDVRHEIRILVDMYNVDYTSIDNQIKIKRIDEVIELYQKFKTKIPLNQFPYHNRLISERSGKSPLPFDHLFYFNIEYQMLKPHTCFPPK